MGVNKVQKADGTVLVDISGDTVARATLAMGVTAHAKNGKQIQGEATFGGGVPNPVTAGDTPVLFNPAIAKATSSSALIATSVSLTVPRAGTWRFIYVTSDCYQTAITSRLYKNGVAAGAQHASQYNAVWTDDIACAAGDTIIIWIKGGTQMGSTVGSAGRLAACIDWDNGF